MFRRALLAGIVGSNLFGCGSHAEHPFAENTGIQHLPIINGHVCSVGESPTAVGIMLQAFVPSHNATIRTPICAGTLIAPDVVLTAAHCLDVQEIGQSWGYELEKAKFLVTREAQLQPWADKATTKTPLPPDTVAAEHFVMHPGYQYNPGAGLGHSNDAGLLFLPKTMTAVQPEIVITPQEGEQLMVNATVSIAGWGLQEEEDGPGLFGNKRCATTTINELGEYEMQIGGDSTTARKCGGDSGGPTYMAVVATSQRKSRVIGITLGAYDGSDCGKGGIDTRVDKEYDWIDSAMKKACQEGTRVWCEVQGVIPAAYYDGAGGSAGTAGAAGASGQAGTDAGLAGQGGEAGHAGQAGVAPSGGSAGMAGEASGGSAPDPATGSPNPDAAGGSCQISASRETRWLWLALLAGVATRCRWRRREQDDGAP